MQLIYLPANMAWVFVFGEDLSTASIVPMGDHGRFFDSRGAAVEAARKQRLRVLRSGRVEALDAPEEVAAGGR